MQCHESVMMTIQRTKAFLFLAEEALFYSEESKFMFLYSSHQELVR
jgi:hypothetical protein